MRILLVDDDDEDVLLLSNLLRRSSCLHNAVVEHTVCLADALNLMNTRRYDICLLDYQLGGENGLDLIARMTERDIHIPVILLTGHGDEQVAVEAMKAGALDYLSKRRLTEELLSKAVRYARRLHRESEQRRKAEKAHRKSEARFAAFMRHLPGIATVADSNGKFLYANKTFEQTHGVSSNRWQNGRLSDLHTGDALAVLPHSEQNQMPLYPICETMETTQHSDGIRHWLTYRFPLESEGSSMPLVGTIALDITDRKQTEEALYRANEHLQVTLESIGDAVITTDADGYVDYINPAAEVLTGWSNITARGQSLMQVFNVIQEDGRQAAGSAVTACLTSGTETALPRHITLIHRDGRQFAIQESLSPILDRQGHIAGAIVIFHDVTQTRDLAQKLSYQASHDNLTGLVNRREFERRLQAALDSARNSGMSHTLCYLDLDQFKIVNDTCGHFAGDELLRSIASLIQGQIRSADTLARLGGDEFGLLLTNCAPEKAQELAERIRRAIKDFRFLWQGKSFSVGVSIGLVGIHRDSMRLDDLLSAADVACYAAKERGRNCVHVYRANDAELARRQGQMQWVHRIQSALEENRFRLYYQSIAPLQNASEIRDHYEILLRMVDETGKLVPPMSFIPAAERYDLMPMVDRWVINKAFATYAEGHKSRKPDFSACCAINLSGTSLSTDTLLDYIVEQFARYQVPPQAICFEITETAAIANTQKAIQFMTKLKELGCQFSLDDFGSGLSSFAYLKEMPVDFLKIDGTFIKDLTVDPINCAIVESIHNIGRRMGIHTIAEFVETQETFEKLKSIGVDFVQGYAIAPPRPLNECTPGRMSILGVGQ